MGALDAISLASSYDGLPAGTIISRQLISTWTAEANPIRLDAGFTLEDVREFLASADRESLAHWLPGGRFFLRGRIVIDPVTDILLVTDVSNTFMPEGELPVRAGDRVVPVVRRTLDLFPLESRFAVLDKHQYGSVSLASSFVGYAPGYRLTYEEVGRWTERDHRIAPHALFTLAELKTYLAVVRFQILWPDHAMDGTDQWRFHPALSENDFAFVGIKGMVPTRDSYSGWFDNGGAPTGLADEVRHRRSRAWRVYNEGLAEDFCVGAGAVDATKLGYKSYLVIDATKPVDLPASGDYPGSREAMYREFERVGVRVITSEMLAAA